MDFYSVLITDAGSRMQSKSRRLSSQIDFSSFWSVINLWNREMPTSTQKKTNSPAIIVYTEDWGDYGEEHSKGQQSIVHVIVDTIDDLFIFKCCITNIMSSAFDPFRPFIVVVVVARSIRFLFLSLSNVFHNKSMHICHLCRFNCSSV